MNRTADAVVVGAGIAGAATFFELVSLGVGRVLLSERRGLTASATSATGGFIQYHFCRDEAETRLTQASLPIFEHWSGVVGVGDCGFVASGYIRLEPEHRAEGLRERVAMLQRLGVETSIIGPDDVARLAPELRTEGVAVAAWEPGSGYADPDGTVAGYIEAGTRLGGELLTNTPVTGVRSASGQVTGVETSDGAIDAPLVVLTAGAWSSGLLAPLGVALPVEVWMTQWLGVEVEPALPATLPTVGDGVSGSYFRALRPGSAGLLVGLGGVGRRPVVDLDEPEASIPANLAETARERVAARLAGQRDVRTAYWRSGPVAQTPDALPIIDRHPEIDGLFFAAGDCGSSFKTGPAIGRALAEWALRGRPEVVDVAPFRLARFAPGE